MIVSVCVATVACAPRWRRLGFNDCKGSGFSEKHQTAKGKVASHAQPQTPEHPAPSMPSPSHSRAPSLKHARASSLPHPKRPSPKHAQASSLPHPFRKPSPPTLRKESPSEKPPAKGKPSHPAKAIFGRIFAPAKNRQAPPKPPPPKNPKSALPSKEERSKISIGPHRLSGSAKHLGYLSNLRALKQA